MNKTFRALPFGLLLWISSAHAGWYEVRSYVGTIGAEPVHVSLQTFDYINHGEPAQWRVEGSYYYDALHVPIPIKGQRQPDGSMVLCEAVAPPSTADSLSVPAPSAANPVPCPISLTRSDQGAVGEWKGVKQTLPIALRQVGRLDNTAQPLVEGVVEVPMWYHTQGHLLLGVYRSSRHCPVSMLQLRLVNTRSGHIDRSIAFPCQAGMIMTSIYANVSPGPEEGQVTVGFQGGRMGYFKVLNIDRRAASRK